MDRDTAVKRIRRGLGYRGTDKDTEIVEALQDTQQELEQGDFLPWFLLSEVTSAVTVSDEERVALPSGFLRETDWEDALYYFDGDAADASDVWNELPKDSISYLRDVYPGVGSPLAYALDDEYYRLFPTPDDVYTLKQMFFKADTTLGDNVENKWLTHAHKWMIGETGLVMAEDLRDKAAVALFTRRKIEGRTKVIRNDNARREAAQRPIMGGED
ncbi:hypothetical protein CMI37_11440 [Candidatus Pacearchaeota archaeon]|nr:hypothetical protein [Candidatus Pacearchaeota archaeon]|tara:strand:- start:318 stop:962 length:645 start_codon:yes stop_codon:yes gene_type:complete